MFMEEDRGSRINHKRLEDIKETANPEEICTACPFCMTMLTDAAKETGDETLITRDIAEIVAEAIK
jgi:Fe-S oxidoreductase